MSGTQRIATAAALVALLAMAAGCVGDASGAPMMGPDGAIDVAPDAGPVAEGDAGILPPPPAATRCDCFDGDGDYCEADVARRAADMACEALGADGSRLLHCDTGTWTVASECAAGCEAGESPSAASCALPVCDCFVSVAWCGAGVARHGLSLDPPCRVPLADEHDQDILGCEGARWVVKERCADGCFEAPTGTPDACVETRTPRNPGWETCAHRALLHSGLHPEASDRLRCAGVTADRITQTIGYATASAGYHAPDGTADGHQYTAAVDVSTRGMSESQIRSLLLRLAQNGFAAWYRKPGYDGWPRSEAPHIHGVFAGVVMKSQLRGQVRDYLLGRNGLSSHTHYSFYSPPRAALDIVRLLYSRHYTPP